MYEIIRNVIISGRFELNDMLNKIDTLWVQGGITDEQRAELITLARAGADPTQTYAPVQAQLEKLSAALDTLTERVMALETGPDTPTDPVPPTEDWPLYVQPMDAHDAYHTGDRITYGGARFTCIAPAGVAVVWSPGAYPAYWQAYVEPEPADERQ